MQLVKATGTPFQALPSHIKATILAFSEGADEAPQP
jgi:hypothetical protein